MVICKQALAGKRHVSREVYGSMGCTSRAFVNGNFITMDESRPHARAVAVSGERIVAVGDDAGAIAAAGPAAEVYDLRGLTVTPGFIDAHIHLASFGLGLEDVELSTARSIGDILESIRARAGTVPPGEWVVAHGYNHLSLVERRHPTANDLDRVSPGNPVYLRHVSGHLSVANNLALRMAGIDRHTPDPGGGLVGRDPVTGEPDGILYESAQMLVRRLRLPHPGGDLVRALRLAGQELARWGVTSCHEAWAGRLAPWEMEAYIEALEKGVLKVRVCLMRDGAATGSAGVIPPSLSHYLGRGPLKFFADGSITAGTAAFSSPYERSGAHARVRDGDLARVESAVASGERVAVHAMGDLAIDAVLDAVGRAGALRAEIPPIAGQPARRNRIEHCGLPSGRAVARMSRLGMIVVTQPSFIRESGDSYVSILGEDRAAGLFPVRSLIKAGVRVAFGTDIPASRTSPIQVIHDAVNRDAAGGRRLGAQEAVSATEALRSMTVEGAYASLEEEVKGRIRPGMFADFVVLSDDITRTSPSRIAGTEVVSTIIGGEVVFSSRALEW